MINLFRCNEDKKYMLIMGLLFFFSFVLIFFQLGKKPLGHFREEHHAGSLDKDINWITLNNPLLKYPMHYNYQNYHEYRYSTIVQNILENHRWLLLKVKNGGTPFVRGKHYDLRNQQSIDITQIPKEINLSMPTYNQAYFHKGPIYFWLAAMTSKVIGFTKFSVRLWSALLGFGSIVICYLLSKEIFDKYTALWSIFILSTTFQFIHVHGARSVSIDTIFVFFFLVVIYCLIQQKKYPKLFYLSAVFLAIAILTRSVLIILPLTGVFFLIDFLLIEKKNFLKNSLLKWLVGLIIIFSIFSPWVILQYQYKGKEFIQDVQRFQIREEFKHKVVLAMVDEYVKFQYNLFSGERPLDWEFYPWTIFKGAFPWSIFAILAFVYNFKIACQEKKKEIFVILGVIAAVLCFVYVKAQNWVRYMIDIYPFLAILIAKVFRDLCLVKKNWWLKIGMIVTFIAFREVIVPFNFNPVWLGGVYTGLLFGALFMEYFFKNIKDYPLLSWSIVTHFSMIAVINILQPFF